MDSDARRARNLTGRELVTALHGPGLRLQAEQAAQADAARATNEVQRYVDTMHGDQVDRIAAEVTGNAAYALIELRWKVGQCDHAGR